jgi:hypothetical protein
VAFMSRSNNWIAVLNPSPAVDLLYMMWRIIMPNPRNCTKIFKGFIRSKIITKLNSTYWKAAIKNFVLLSTATTYISGTAQKEQDSKLNFKNLYFRS